MRAASDDAVYEEVLMTAPGSPVFPPPQVVVVGAGPVGLTLAIDLGRRGVRCLVVERNTSARRLPKMERLNPRSMEIYRRLGLADAIRAAGMPGHVPMDVYVVSRLIDTPILRMPYPSPNDAKARTANVRDGSLPLEGNQIISQYTLEPVLRAAAEALPSVTVRSGCALTSFEQDDTGVTVHLETADGGTEIVRADYLAGCDGGASTVRKQLGISLHGRGSIGTLRQVFFRSDDLVEKVPRVGMARHFFVADTDTRMIGTLIVVQDDQRHFVFHTALEEDADMVSAIRDVIGVPVQVEVLATTSWKLHLLLAGSYGQGRVMLVGDAAHLVIPMGALGLNTGIADATDLSWKLAAALAGWGGPELLPSYAHERRLVGERVIEASEYAANGTATWRKAATPAIFDDTPEGRQAREAVARLADVEQRKGQEMLGIELGYRYLGSPVIWYDRGPQAGGYGYAYEPVSSPGARLPHAWADEQVAVHDLCRDGFTLLRLGDTTADTGELENAMASLGVPLQVLELPAPPMRALYGAGLLLLRPDLHVAWRGDEPPADPSQVATTVTGWAGHPT